jgi:hypothetical protein
MKKIYIYCDGGFGNRFNSLIVGLLLSKIGNYIPTIIWPKTSVCEANFYSIFDCDYDVIENTLDYFFPIVEISSFAMHGNFLNFNTEVLDINNQNSIDDILTYFEKSNKDIFVYNNDKIPKYISNNLIKYYYNYLDIKIKSDILNTADDFIQNNLNEKFYGLHLRDTDFHQNQDLNRYDNFYHMVLENKDKKYFVCSDNLELEIKFNNLKNVVIRNKVDYVKKVNKTNNWSNNIRRSENSVVEAIIDLIILSKSDMIDTSESSFLKTAKLFKHINNG